LPSKAAIPDIESGGYSHDLFEEPADSGLLVIARFAFVLASPLWRSASYRTLCRLALLPELTLAYALTVLAGILGLTLLRITGYLRHEERVEGYRPYLPLSSAGVLVVMGLGFIAGVF